MKQCLLDSDILSLLLRNDKITSNNFIKYLDSFDTPLISIINFYEIVAGLKYKDDKKFLPKFLEFCNNCKIIGLDINAVDVATNIYAQLRQKGVSIDQADILIAGICISNDLSLVTNNEKHYTHIEGLEIINWSRV